MKKLLLALLFCVPVLLIGQTPDTSLVRIEVDSLIKLNRSLAGQKKFEEALQVIEAATTVTVGAFGKENALYATCLFNHGRTFYYMKRNADAETFYLKALSIHEKTLGKENVGYAEILYNIGVLYFYMGEYDKSEMFYINSLNVREKVIGTENTDYAQTSFFLGLLYHTMGKYYKAEPFYLKAKSIRQKILGDKHPDYAWSLNNLAYLYSDMGRYEMSEPLYLEALSIREGIVGRQHGDYSSSLNNLAILYTKMGRYKEAELLYRESMKIRAALFGKESIEYIAILINLSNLYHSADDLEKAEYYALSAMDIFQNKPELKEHSFYVNCLHVLCMLYKDTGQYNKSESLYLQIKDIRRETQGEQHPEYALTLNNLANLYSDMGKYEKAEYFYLESIKIKKEVLGDKHYDYATNLNDLALLYMRMGRYQQAEQIYINSLNIEAESLGKESSSYASSLNNLASLYILTNNFKQAELLYLESKSILEKVLGKNNKYYSLTMLTGFLLYWKSNRIEGAIHILADLYLLDRSEILQSARYLSEQERASFVRLFSNKNDNYFSFIHSRPGNTGPLKLCYDNILFHKGFLLSSSNRIKRFAQSDSISTRQYEGLNSYHRRLASQYSLPIAERDSALIADLETKANTLEKELTRTVAGYGEALRQVSWQEVQAQLRPGEAAVEFVHYNYYTPKPTDSIMYAALVLLPGDTAPHFVPLFEERQITSLLKGASGGNLRKINECYGERGQELHALIWKPLEELLKGVKTVYCSPSGLLHRLNLGAMRVKGQQTYGEIRSIVTLGSTRQLVVGSSVSQSATATAAVFGGIRYETDTTAMFLPDASDVAATRGLADIRSFYSDSTARGGSWNYLSGTRAEALDISKLLHNARYTVKLDTGYRATEEVIRNTGRGKNSPRILHIATHGFFYPDPKVPADKRSLSFDRENMVFRLSDNPMMRSGLILAGANQVWQTGKGPGGREDGILTAYEISHMDLSGTELVVLSACETGLGDIEGNEGVYGLQRAFKIAGAKYLLMSLWKVNDASTREFMTEFYRLWLEGKQAIPDAFRGAQAFLKNKYPDSPFHWAGFILVE